LVDGSVEQVKNWRRRWFVMRGFLLKYYKSQQKVDTKAKPQGARTAVVFALFVTCASTPPFGMA